MTSPFEQNELYLALSHSMQSGVATTLALDLKDGYDDHHCNPKHLRTGVNSSMVNNAAMVDLLIQKGIFTQEEFTDCLNKWMKREVEMYEKSLSERMKAKVTLG